MEQWLGERTAAMAEGAAGRLEPASGAPWQQDAAPPEVLLASCRQLGAAASPRTPGGASTNCSASRW